MIGFQIIYLPYIFINQPFTCYHRLLQVCAGPTAHAPPWDFTSEAVSDVLFEGLGIEQSVVSRWWLEIVVNSG